MNTKHWNKNKKRHKKVINNNRNRMIKKKINGMIKKKRIANNYLINFFFLYQIKQDLHTRSKKKFMKISTAQ